MPVPSTISLVGLFLKGLLKRWWALMSCAAFTIVGVYAAAFNEAPDWIVRSSIALGVFFLLLGAFLTWRDTYIQLVGEKEAHSGPVIVVEYDCDVKHRPTDKQKPITLRTLPGSGDAFTIQVQPIVNGNRTAKFSTISDLAMGESNVADHIVDGVGLIFRNDLYLIFEEGCSKIQDTKEYFTPRAIPLKVAYKDIAGNGFITEYTIEYRCLDQTGIAQFRKRYRAESS